MRNPRIVAAARLHRSRHRRETGQTLLEGPEVVAEAVAAGIGLVTLFGRPDDLSRRVATSAGIGLVVVSDPVLERIAGTETPRGPIAIVDIPPTRPPEHSRLLVAWGVGDPGNCGTLVRTAAAFGYGFVSGPESADPWSPKVLRSGAGGHFRTEVSTVATLGDLAGYRVVGTVPAGGESPGPVPDGTAILIGSEAHGLPADVVDGCDGLVTIPMPGGTESLNAAVAGAIVAYLGAVPVAD